MDEGGMKAGPIAGVVRFPPGRRYLVIPTDDRAAALAGLSMLAASGRGAQLAQCAVMWAVRLVGPRAVPGRRETWRPPTTPQRWRALTERWRDEVGPFESIALYERPQASRMGIVVTLVAGGRPSSVVKLRGLGDADLRNESALLARIPASIGGVRTPRLIATGEEEDIGLGWMAMSAVAASAHRPMSRRGPG